jgi:RimJ/RimL family protein N-acetyltransferase
MRLARLLGAVAPSSWPPELYEPDDLSRMERLLQDPQNHGWTLYYLLTQADPVRLVGVAGFGGAPTAEGVVDLGYSILPEFRRQGLATEAVEALVTFAAADQRVRAIAAQTYPRLAASIGVLSKSGFRLVPSVPGSDTVRYERHVRGSTIKPVR